MEQLLQQADEVRAAIRELTVHPEPCEAIVKKRQMTKPDRAKMAAGATGARSGTSRTSSAARSETAAAGAQYAAR
jgi:hypothetical protein